MLGNEWEEILRAREQIEAKEKSDREENERRRLRQENTAQEERTRTVRLAQEEIERKRQAVSLIANQIERIFKDLAKHDPTIKKFPLHEVNQDPIRKGENPSTTISLKWGNKFELTPEEEKLISNYRHIPEIKRSIGIFRLFSLSETSYTPEIPDTILQHDFYSISAHIDFNTTTIGQQNLKSDSINSESNNIVIPVANALRKPSHSLSLLRKGSDYWKGPEPVDSGGSGDSGCCCNQGQ